VKMGGGQKQLSFMSNDRLWFSNAEHLCSTNRELVKKPVYG
jgi:hypothetical protein